MNSRRIDEIYPNNIGRWEVANDVIVNIIKPYLLSFSNVAFEGSYNIDTNVWRHCFEVDGYNNLLLFLQCQESTEPIVVGICTMEEKNSTDSERKESCGYTEYNSGRILFNLILHNIASENILKMIGFSHRENGNIGVITAFVKQNADRYIYFMNENYNSYLYPDLYPGAERSIYTAAPNNRIDGVVLSRHAIVREGSNLIGQLDDLFQYSHKDFDDFRISNRIAVDGIIYRQIGSYGIFIEDDEE